MPPRISLEKTREFDKYLKDGHNVMEASRRAGVSKQWAYDRSKGFKKRDQSKFYAVLDEANLPDPKPREKLSEDALRAVEDFEFFRLRYFGHVSTPWQVDAANRMVAYLGTDEKEYCVVNVPPGAGKSTTFVHDLIAWAIVKDRSVRVLIGSRTERQARQYVGRLKTTLDRTHPPVASDGDKRKGLAVDATATLTGDFGRFKPQNPDVWRNEEFTVAQINDIAASDKERTVSAYGMDGRYDLIAWDDLVDKRTLRTQEARENLINMWETEAETRLEPGGLLILQGQRMAADDLYRYALDIKAGDPDDFESEAERPNKYHHVIYRAHDDERCAGDHAKTAAPWTPDGSGGCLLDPVRLDWRSLKTIQANRAERFLVMYQQEDSDPTSSLVDPAWISGSGEHPGCWDSWRGAAQPPVGLTGDLVSVCTADPSPTKFWSIQWWLIHPDTNQFFLMDQIRQAMDAPDFLDFDQQQGSFVGVMEEWQQRSKDVGAPITTWVVEANAAARFILQYDHARRWQAKHGVQVIPHQTHRNKADADYGVQTLAPHFRFGRVRLPGKQMDPGRLAAMKLVDEVTKWPNGAYDDCVMAMWFMVYQYSQGNIYTPQDQLALRRPMPSWAQRRGVSA